MGGRGGNKKRGISEGNRRGERICRARAVSSEERTRDRGGGGKSWNAVKTHNGSLGNSETNASRNLSIKDSPVLKSCRGIHGRQILTTKKSLVLSQFQISQRIETSNCYRSKRAKAGDNKWEKSKANTRVKGGMLLVLYSSFLLEKKARVFYLVLMSTSSLSPGTLGIN